MAQRFRTDPYATGLGYPVIAKNSEAFATGDAVYIDTSGFLAKATTSSKVLGFALDTVTVASDNQTVAKVCPKYVPAMDVLMQYTADVAVTQTKIGEYADFSAVTSGGFTVGVNGSGATGQLFILGFDPEGDGSTDQVVVKVAEPQQLAFAQS